MSQSVNDLKELLFEKEHQELDDLHRRLVELAQEERTARSVLQRRVDAVYAQAGSRELLRSAVAEVIDGSLKDAEATSHDALRAALAPVVVGTVRSEIVNNEDLLVQTLSPRMGVMIRDYIASAMKDMMAQINRKLERAMPGSGARLRARAKAAGMTVAEMALAETQKLQVDEIYLVRRGSGQVIDHWSREQLAAGGEAALNPAMGGNRDALVGGFLAAITEFAKEVFEAEKSSLRSLQHDRFQIYLRHSPAYLLALKCSGAPLPGIEKTIDAEFLLIMTTHDDLLSGAAGDEARARAGANGSSIGANGLAGTGRELVPRQAGDKVALKQVLPSLANALEARMSQRYDEIFAEEAAPRAAPRAANPLKMLALGLGLPLLAALGWFGWQSYQVAWTENHARQVTSALSQMNGYPVAFNASQGGRQLTISGLAPSQSVKRTVINDLKAVFPWVTFKDELSVLPAAPDPVDLAPSIADLRRQIALLERQSSENLALLEQQSTGRIMRLERQSTESLALLEQQSTGRIMRLELEGAEKRGRIEAQGRQKITALKQRITRAGIMRAIDRSARRLDTIIRELIGLEKRLGTDPATASVALALARARDAAAKLSVMQRRLAATGAKPKLDGALATFLNDAAGKINGASAALGSLGGVILSKRDARSAPSGPARSAEELALAAERFSIVSASAARRIVLRPVQRSVGDVSSSLTALQKRVDELTPGARQRLEAWVSGNAIFFGNLAEYRNSGRAAAKLDELVALLRQTTVAIRVVGYTDAVGRSASNEPLALSRASTVGEALASRGIAAARIITVGRTNGPDLSADTGPASANRRVQFEIAFADEGAGAK